jgi:hypothetical protein
MNKKIFENARFLPKGDIEANWKKATGFIPLAKEIIIYKPDENYSYSRIKIGDGVTGVNDLPFIVDTDGYLASKDWVDEQIAAIDFPDVNQVYSPNSKNAQSGIAVEGALSPIKEKNAVQDDRISELEDKVIIGTFHTEVESYVEETYPHIMRGASLGSAAGFIVTQMLGVNIFYNATVTALQIPTDYTLKGITLQLAKKNYINRAHRRNISVQFWTINDKEEMKMLIEMGADVIMTDNPDVLYELLNEMGY